MALTSNKEEVSTETKEERRERRKRRKEAEALGEGKDPDETKRLRSYSVDDEDNKDPTDQEAKRRRTRSMDLASPKDWRNEHSISVVGRFDNGDIPAPYREFSKTPFAERILQGFQKAGFSAPSAIQAQSWPIALQGRDMINIARTGSGKTLGFLLPCFHLHLQQQKKPLQGFTPPMLLVLAPTRELSVQIMEEAQKFGRLLGIRSVCCYGGSSKWPQISALERGVECVIATPGTYA